MAWPKPRPPPVTMATWPVRSDGMWVSPSCGAVSLGTLSETRAQGETSVRKRARFGVGSARGAIGVMNRVHRAWRSVTLGCAAIGAFLRGNLSMPVSAVVLAIAGAGPKPRNPPANNLI